MENKRGQGLSLNFLIVAGLALIIFIVLIVVFTHINRTNICVDKGYNDYQKFGRNANMCCYIWDNGAYVCTDYNKKDTPTRDSLGGLGKSPYVADKEEMVEKQCGDFHSYEKTFALGFYEEQQFLGLFDYDANIRYRDLINISLIDEYKPFSCQIKCTEEEECFTKDAECRTDKIGCIKVTPNKENILETEFYNTCNADIKFTLNLTECW